MKKIISVLLAVVMLFTMSTMAFAVVIEGEENVAKCTCDDHKWSPAGSCHCCVLCLNIDKSYLTSCAKKDSVDGTYDGSLCCARCTGIFPCSCGCDCCDSGNIDSGNNGGMLPDVWGEEEQDEFVNGFQKIMQRISKAFNDFFDKIFEFLRLEDLLGSIN